MEDIEPVTLDLDHTWIKLGCYRETDRLNRVLEVYQKALTLAEREDKTSAFVSSIISIHDHKGWLTVEWRDDQSAKSLHHLVDKAWTTHGEHIVTHLATGGRFVAGERK